LFVEDRYIGSLIATFPCMYMNWFISSTFLLSSLVSLW
jgi:uncharacterized protein (DUF3820 family)